jgi:hypothetical protein
MHGAIIQKINGLSLAPPVEPGSRPAVTPNATPAPIASRTIAKAIDTARTVRLIVSEVAQLSAQTLVGDTADLFDVRGIKDVRHRPNGLN